MTYRGRFAPSPSGDLHLGSAATALVAWLRARQAGGSLVLRVEDLDTPRVIRDSEARQLDDLHWLGLDWDEGPDVGGPSAPYRQSDRFHLYDAALSRLADKGLIYRCDCSRSEISAVASAPHAGEEGPRYPGTCRRFGMAERAWKRPAAIRLRVAHGEMATTDAFQGVVKEDVLASVGDLVLQRGDGIFAYQLAVVVDDLAMGITEVVRGADLLSSMTRQILLAELLDGKAPSFAHVPLVVDGDGSRLQKREPRHTLRGLRAAGLRPEQLLADLAKGMRIVDDSNIKCISATELITSADLSRLRNQRQVRIDIQP